MDSQQAKYWTVQQLATVIRMSPDFVLREIYHLEIAAVKNGRVWRIPSDEVYAYLTTKRYPQLDLQKLFPSPAANT